MPALAFCGLEISAQMQRYTITNPAIIGQHIRKRRIELNLKQSDIATMFDVCEDSITAWENGRYDPQVAQYPKIIAFLEYSPFQIDDSTLGGRIKKYRFQNGLSREKFADMIGVDQTSVLAWEANGRKPIKGKMKLLEKILNQKELSE